MGTIRNLFVGTKSKRKKTLPYTYEARVDETAGMGSETVYSHYYSDTICGLIDYLDTHGVEPDHVQVFGVYRGKEIRMDLDLCLSNDRRWLKRPEICRSLERAYKKSLEDRYKGHIAGAPCEFDDRNRTGFGSL